MGGGGGSGGRDKEEGLVASATMRRVWRGGEEEGMAARSRERRQL